MGYRAFRVKMLKVSPKMSARWPQDGPTMAQDGTQMAQDGPKMAPRWPNMAPRWPQDEPKRGPRGAQEGSQELGLRNPAYGRMLTDGAFWGHF